jgi:arginine deiminase
MKAVEKVKDDPSKPVFEDAPIVTQAAVQEKTLKEILEERENELKEMEQLDTIQDKGYMEALATDIEQKPQKPSAEAEPGQSEDDLTAELKKKFNID